MSAAQMLQYIYIWYIYGFDNQVNWILGSPKNDWLCGYDMCFVNQYLHLPLTFLRWIILDQLASYTDERQMIMWRCR